MQENNYIDYNINSPRSKRQESYNIMNDDIDNDIELQLEIQELAPNENDKTNLYFLQNNNSLHSIEDKFNNTYSNSLSSISSNSSENSKKKTYQKLTFEEVESSLQKHFKQAKLFSELDVLITYIKGQKHIYTQSYYITQQKVHLLIFPSLIITSSIMVIAPIIQVYPWSGYLLTGLNAILTIFISILNFWNLQYIMTQYNSYATHFDRLETSLIMTRNKIYLINNVQEQTSIILEKIKETENRMMEMKDSTSILIPTEIKTQTPIISNFDIFAFIHKMEQMNKMMIIHYKDIKNEIRYIMFNWKYKDKHQEEDDIIHEDYEIESIFDKKDTYYRSQFHNNSSIKKESERFRLMHLLKEKESTKNNLLLNHQKYSKIEEVFIKEIYIAEKNQNNFYFLFMYYFCFFYPTHSSYNINEFENILETTNNL
jgi:ribosomal protein L21